MFDSTSISPTFNTNQSSVDTTGYCNISQLYLRVTSTPATSDQQHTNTLDYQTLNTRKKNQSH